MIKYIHSATILVTDQDRAIDFYVNTLGFEKRDDRPYGDPPGTSRWVVVAPPGAETALALVRPEDMGAGADVAGGYKGISLIADDVNATYEELSARGSPLPRSRSGCPGARWRRGSPTRTAIASS